jgi:hypothetical protein
MDLESGRIESWKEIAEYLNCSPRAARVWAKERGLPVHHLPGDKRSRVHAFRPELDQWLKKRRGPGPNEELEGHADVAAGPQPSVSGDQTPAPPIDPAKPIGSNVARRRMVIIGVAAVGLVLLLGTATTWRRHPEAPISLRAQGATLEALDSTGGPVWNHVFPATLHQDPTTGQELVNRSWVGDLDGDGRNEVLFLATQPVGAEVYEDTLYCFGPGGETLWSFRLTDTFRFTATSYGPPWHIGLLAVYDLGGEKRIALSLGHQTWWPAPVLTFNSRGERLSTFVGSGLIYQLRTAIRNGRPLIIAGSVSNSRRAASLVVLDGENPVGTTPEEPGSEYRCLSCPAGEPLRYFWFPRTELALTAKQPYNFANRVLTTSSEVSVAVEEVSDRGKGRENAAMTYFQFDSSFNLLDARWGDGFAMVHEVYEGTGALRHTVAECPNKLPIARAYEAGKGLVDVPLVSVDRKADR